MQKYLRYFIKPCVNGLRTDKGADDNTTVTNNKYHINLGDDEDII